MLRQDFWYYLTAAMSSGKIQDFKKRKGGGALVYGDGAWLGERYRDVSPLARVLKARMKFADCTQTSMVQPHDAR